MDKDKDSTLKLENQLCFAIYTASREITKLYRPLLEELGLTYTQYITMLALWEKDKVTVKELGNQLFLDSGTLTPLLKKLESMQLVLREREKADERNVIISLTEQGLALKEKAIGVPYRLFSEAGVSLEEAIQVHTQVTQLLKKVQKNVGQE